MISFKKALAILVLGGVALSTSAVAGVILVEDISINMTAVVFYTSAGGFEINEEEQRVDIRTFGALEYDYYIDNATVAITASTLISDDSTGGVVAGEFAGGATLTVTGDLIYEPTDTFITNGTILQAQMASGNWMLVEDSAVPSRFGASVDYTPGNGGLNAGIAVGGGDILQIASFNCGFSATMVQPYNPSDFSGVMMIGPLTSLQITAVPEPCTVLLLAVGGVGLLRKRRK